MLNQRRENELPMRKCSVNNGQVLSNLPVSPSKLLGKPSAVSKEVLSKASRSEQALGRSASAHATERQQLSRVRARNGFHRVPGSKLSG